MQKTNAIMIILLAQLGTSLVAQQVVNPTDQNPFTNQSLEQSTNNITPTSITETQVKEPIQDSDSRNTLVDPDAYEPDNTATTYRIIGVSSVPQSQDHTIHISGDQDWYRFMAYEGRACRFVVTGISVQLALFRDDGVTPAPTTGNYIANEQWEITANGNYKLRVTGSSGATGAYTITYSYVTSADIYEPDDSFTDPTGYLILTDWDYYQQRSLHTYTDQDWFMVETYSGGTYTIWSTGYTDVRISLYQADATTLIMQDDDSGEGNNFSISYTPTESSVCYFKITGTTNAIGNYTLHSNCTVPADAYEPDNSITQFTPLSMTTNLQTQNHTLHDANDVDWYGFQAVQGRTYAFYSTSVDGFIWGGLYKNDGTLVWSSDDMNDEALNFNIEYTATQSIYMKFKVTHVEAGTPTHGRYCFYYRSWVSDDSFEPDNTAAEAQTLYIYLNDIAQTHTLTITNNVHDQDWFEFHAEQGSTYYICSTGTTDTQAFIYQQDGTTLLCSDDESGGEHNFALSFSPTSTATYKLKVAGYSTGTYGYYDIHYSFVTNPDSYEPDNSYNQYTTFTPSPGLQSQFHTFHNETDKDWFRFYASSDMIYTFSANGDTDTRIWLYLDNGTSLLQSDDDSGTNFNFYMEFIPPTSGYYKIMVDSYSGFVGYYNFFYQSRPALNTPSNLNITSSGSQITITWTVVSGATSYRIEASDNPTTGFTGVGTTTAATWSTTANLTRRYYRVIAIR